MITVENLSYSYDGDPVLDGLSLALGDEWVVLAGPNGSGKTTLIRQLNGLLEPDGGSVLVDGTPVQDDPVAARTAVGMVFQSPRSQFVASTVGADVAFGPENLGLDHEEIDRRVDAALSAVNLDGREDERIDALSGGERARLAIAGALAMEPEHLVLDEPFAGLDWPAQRSVLGHLDDLAADGVGIVVVTHDLRDLRTRADRVIGLRDGEIAFDLSPEAATEALPDIDVRVPDGW
ncbi:ATP-binding cassette domain-containing protein [Halovenus sp. WSH3]|uniref:ATP-binding cassette domain-containing protein n=1 Tax=Halovenus carboxidivorans TaxID=2692199 RepID=A0A6B0TE16_9EURY|nr:ABC transporter ATP-binding protein [Halovenus carboxidivorans]MXR53170.1 ATP-binding cassette domain-containing protein [Halovenus carboxidivorans]